MWDCVEDSDCNVSIGEYCHSDSYCALYEGDFCDNYSCGENDGGCTSDRACPGDLICGIDIFLTLHPLLTALTTPGVNLNACELPGDC